MDGFICCSAFHTGKSPVGVTPGVVVVMVKVEVGSGSETVEELRRMSASLSPDPELPERIVLLRSGRLVLVVVVLLVVLLLLLRVISSSHKLSTTKGIKHPIIIPSCRCDDPGGLA